MLVQKKVTSLQRFSRRFFTVQNVLLGVGWLAWLALLIFVQAQTADLAPFDPYEILRVSRLASSPSQHPSSVHGRAVCSSPAHYRPGYKLPFG